MQKKIRVVIKFYHDILKATDEEKCGNMRRKHLRIKLSCVIREGAVSFHFMLIAENN